LIPLLFVFACEGEETAPSNTLGSEIELSMTEFIDADQRILTLKFLTLKDFPCINNRIKYETTVDQQTVSIVLEKVEEAEVCLDAIGPASAFIELGQLDEKEYDLQIQLGESIIKHGTLAVTKDAYLIHLDDEAGITLLNPALNRVPAQTVWGTIKYENQDSKKLLNFFDEAMDIAGATDKKFAEGDYGYFRVNSDGSIVQTNEQQKELDEQAFLYDFSGKSEDIKQVLQQLNANFQNAHVRFYNARGEEFRSWDFN